VINVNFLNAKGIHKRANVAQINSMKLIDMLLQILKRVNLSVKVAMLLINMIRQYNIFLNAKKLLKNVAVD
jgi:restriction endonuclease